MDILALPEWRLAVALLLGLIVGVERERRFEAQGFRGAAGIRTFGLVALLGGIAGWLNQAWLVVVAASFVAALNVVGYYREESKDIGITSEVALFVVFMLGVLAQSYPGHALGLALVVTLLLAFRDLIHHAVTRVLTRTELIEGLVIATAAVVVLPLLPNEPIDPWNAINPATIWRLVILVLGVIFAGHIAQRIFGDRLGLTIAGLASGFVSSAATVGAMGARARTKDITVNQALTGASASSIATFIELAILVGAAFPALLSELAIVFISGAAVAFIATLILSINEKAPHTQEPDQGRAFDIKTAIAFAVLITVVSVVSAAVKDSIGEGGIVIGAAIAGFADAHAISASAASLSANQVIGMNAAALAVMAATSTNTLTKIVVGYFACRGTYALRLGIIHVAILIAAWASFLL